MKIVINFDFFNAIRNVKDPLPLKIVRNETKYEYAPLIIMSLDGIFNVSLTSFPTQLLFCYSIYVTSDLIINGICKKNFDKDFYALNAMEKLRMLPVLLNTINVETDYNMLLSSKLYERHYKIEKCEDSILPIKEEKYIYVPSYGFDGEEKQTSILQEHSIGSKRYILSVEEPKKRYRRVLVNNNA